MVFKKKRKHDVQGWVHLSCSCGSVLVYFGYYPRAAASDYLSTHSGCVKPPVPRILR